MTALTPPEPTAAVRTLAPAWALALLATGLVAAGAAVAAQDEAAEAQVAEVSANGPLETSIVVEALEIERGPGDREVRRWVPVETLAVGDEVHYTIRVRNPGKQPVGEVVVTKRLPFGVRYQRGSAAGPACEIQFSQDGGQTFATLDQWARTAKRSRKAPPTEFTHVRWLLSRPLAPGATALLRFRATFS